MSRAGNRETAISSVRPQISPSLAAAITRPAPAGLAIESRKRSLVEGVWGGVAVARARHVREKKKECRGELHVTVSAGLHGRAPTFPPPSPYRAPLDQRASTTPLTARENERDAAPTPVPTDAAEKSRAPRTLPRRRGEVAAGGARRRGRGRTRGARARLPALRRVRCSL